MKFIKKFSIAFLLIGLVSSYLSLREIPPTLRAVTEESHRPTVLDKDSNPLVKSFSGKWNDNFQVALQDIPPLLQKAVVVAEDKRFFDHSGVDWLARMNALVTNLRHGAIVRGASTITEQVVRIIHPRPRTLWSRWIEGIEANLLEFRFSKQEILEFYLNQIPYSARRKGVLQASKYYFDRDLNTLSEMEMLALAVLIRSPNGLNLYNSEKRVNKRLNFNIKDLSDKLRGQFRPVNFNLRESKLAVSAPHFIRFVRGENKNSGSVIKTTLDSDLQEYVQKLLDERVRLLKAKAVGNAGVIVREIESGNILAWVNSNGETESKDHSFIDTVLTPRQPGSTLKPLLYALALENGFTAATKIDDAPLTTAVGTGVHEIHNYSNYNYGQMTLRQCLANSLNIPAIKVIKEVGIKKFYELLGELNFRTLTFSSQYYGEGLALGNVEVTLYDLVAAYSALANKGIFTPNKIMGLSSINVETNKIIFNEEAASLIGDILSDNKARSLEFGTNSVLNFPYQTAVKTGTSTDYRDSWTIAYNDKYIVGAWFGNLDSKPMKGITGSTGPAIVVRGIMNFLNSNRNVEPLFLSKGLLEKKVCSILDKDCNREYEYFISEKNFQETILSQKNGHSENKGHIQIIEPLNRSIMAIDPRTPDNYRRFKLMVKETMNNNKKGNLNYHWIINGILVAKTKTNNFLWKPVPGKHQLIVRLMSKEKTLQEDKVAFSVVR